MLGTVEAWWVGPLSTSLRQTQTDRLATAKQGIETYQVLKTS
jgi:hypothetical protein